jgi:hypothetical protein
MKAIVICQPWAWAIFHGKTHENRTWPSKHRGPLLIIAGTSTSRMRDGLLWMRHNAQDVPSISDLEFGKAIGVVRMVGCQRDLDLLAMNLHTIWTAGPWCHIYADAKEFSEPIPVTGRQRIFDVPVTDVLAKQLGMIFGADVP